MRQVAREDSTRHPVLGARLAGWMLWPRPDDLPMIIVVVDDGDDRELTAVLGQEEQWPSRRFGCEWGTGRCDGRWLVGLHLFTPGGGFERLLFTDDVDRELLEATLAVPHVVAIMPQAIAGDARAATALAARLSESLVVEVDRPSAHVARLLSPRGTN
jgi:hypothetical protein